MAKTKELVSRREKQSEESEIDEKEKDFHIEMIKCEVSLED